MVEYYWAPIEWEVLQEKVVLKPPFQEKKFVNTLDVSMKGLEKVTIFRDEDYNLKGEGEGDYVSPKKKKKLESGTLIKKSILKGRWDYFYKAKMINCFLVENNIRHNFEKEEVRVSCSFDLYKLKLSSPIKKEKKNIECLTEFYINGPGKTFMYVDSTCRKVKMRVKKKREKSQDSYEVMEEENFSRDTVFIQYGGTGFYISQVPKEYEPLWSEKLSIEYRKEYGYIPNKKEREGIGELAGFLMGRDLLLVGRTEYGRGGERIKAIAQNPQSINVRKVCGLSAAEILPVHRYFDEGGNFQHYMQELLPRYLESDMREGIHHSLPLYWTSFLLPVQTAIPVIASGVEMLQKCWFALEENQSAGTYYPPERFKYLLKPVREALEESFDESCYKAAMKNKLFLLNQMSVRDRNQIFFEKLGIAYGEKEENAIKARNRFTHGTAKGDTASMIEALHTFQVLYAKIVLRILGYEGEYIDWSEQGYPRKTIPEK